MLYIITQVYDELAGIQEKGGKITLTGLYQFFIEYWIDHDDERVKLTRLGKEILAEEIAWELWSKNLRHIHWNKLPETVASYFKNHIQAKDEEYAAHEIRAASFLVRNTRGYYRFAHQSFLEFFVAKRLARGINTGNYDIIQNKLSLVSPEIAKFLGECVHQPNLLAEKYIEFYQNILITWRASIYSEFSIILSEEEKEAPVPTQKPSLKVIAIFYALNIPCHNKLTDEVKTSTEIVNEMLSILSSQEALVVRHILGLGVSPLTLSEIGQHILNGVTGERPRQVMKLALDKLQANCHQQKFKELLLPMLGIEVTKPSREEMLQMKLTDLVWVSGQVYNVLSGRYRLKSRPQNMQELLQLSKKDLSEWRNCGKKKVKEIVAAVESLGFQMRE